MTVSLRLLLRVTEGDDEVGADVDGDLVHRPPADRG